MMKNLQFLILLIFMASGSFAQQYGWVPLPWINDTDVIKRIYQSGDEAWLLTHDKLYYSANYPSVQFTQLYYNSDFKLYDMTLINQGTVKYGWLVGSDSRGARTTDTSALVWTDMYIGGDTQVSVSFPDKTTGYVTGTDKSLYKTIDGGANWTEIYSGLSVSSVDALFFVNTLIGYCGGASPSFKKTTDGGLTWTNVGGVTGSMFDISFYDSNHGYAVGVSDIFYYHGSSWVRVANSSGSVLYTVFFVSPTQGWAAGLNGTIIHSTDGGAIWTAQASGTTVTLRDVFFTSPTNGYAVGNKGTILHYTQITGVEEHPAQPTTFNMEQNYPNPFNSETKISYSLAIPAQVQLTVCNMFGQQVALLDEGFKPAGSFSADFNGEGLPSGIYYYRLQCGDRHETRKMTLIK
jgi:photosystem II stability/assembly factor-like uncharacterized protein